MQPLPDQQHRISNWIKVASFISFIAYAAVFLATKINIINADVGRLIVNGKVFSQTGTIISTNFYSYTQPDLPTINHHWGTGVILFHIHRLLGFIGLSLFNVIVMLGAAMLFIVAALRFADWRIVFFTAVLSVPMLALRTEVRPEAISLLFFGIVFYVLILFRANKLSFSFTLLLLAISHFLWVNIHLYFFISFLLIGCFLLDEFLNRRNAGMLRHYFILMVVLMIISLINPFFIKGFLVPLTIFNKMTYMVAEIQSVFFLQMKKSATVFLHFEIQSVVAIMLIALTIIQKNFRKYIFLLLPFIFFLIQAFAVARGISIFSLICIPAGALLIQYVIEQFNGRAFQITSNALAIIGGALIISGFANGIITAPTQSRPPKVIEPFYFSPIKYNTGLGLYPQLNASAEFFIQHKLKGPIFNDYDIGGYLIYYLFPEERVFVDGRPEAYTDSFFNQTYIPMQQSIEKFREVENQYHFNCIWFNHMEDTPWAQHFLFSMLGQPDYAPVYADATIVIFLKRNEQNSSVIAQYEIPSSRFGHAPAY